LRGCRLKRRSEAWGSGRETRVHGGVRGWEVREGEVADTWGPRASESELTRERAVSADRADL
jgi:hypothetical protein